jgi:hypothetical protein
MVRFDQVDKLVDNDVVNDLGGQEDRGPMEVDVAAFAARAPSVTEISYFDSRRLNAYAIPP